MDDLNKEQLEKLRQKMYGIEERVRTDPEIIKRKEKLYRKLSTLTREDLDKVIYVPPR